VIAFSPWAVKKHVHDLHEEKKLAALELKYRRTYNSFLLAMLKETRAWLERVQSVLGKEVEADLSGGGEG